MVNPWGLESIFFVVFRVQALLSNRNSMGSIDCFKDLEVWKNGRGIRQQVYRISRTFPAWERYGLDLQMRRTAVSITANIAEGYGRKSWAENKRFCRISRGSAQELRDHITTACDQEYISREIWRSLDTELISLVRMLNSYIRSMEKREASQNHKPL